MSYAQIAVLITPPRQLPPPMKAFAVSQEDGGQSVVVYAPDYATAFDDGTTQLFTSGPYHCARVPHFDQFSPGPVPMMALLEHGWSAECRHCKQSISIESFPEMIDPPTVVIEDRDVFCDQTCASMHGAYLRRRYAGETAIVELITLRYPGSVVKWAFNDPAEPERAAAGFRFPGSRWTARWSAGDAERVSIHRSDVTMFMAQYGAREPHRLL